MTDFVQLNVLALYFAYGLSFYTMGVAIALQYRSYSTFRLANSINLLAVFAVLLGLGEWANLFIPVRVPDFGDLPVWKLLAIQRLVLALAYFFLFTFGVKLINNTLKRPWPFWYLFPTLPFLIWLIMLSRFALMGDNNQIYTWVLHMDCWSRYLLAFPGGLLAALGLYMQIPQVKKINNGVEPLNLWGAISSFLLFAFIHGLVVPNPMNGFGKLLNYDTFRFAFGIPVELVRTFGAILATWSITSLLSIFEIEKHRQIVESRRAEAVFRERERFARDLHDDVIQSIYGSGLELQSAVSLLNTKPEVAAARLDQTALRLKQVIRSLRAYIQDLEDVESLNFRAAISSIVNEHLGDGSNNIKFTIRIDEDLEDRLSQMEKEKKQLILILREALSNIIKHSGANEVQVGLFLINNTLHMSIEDNGRGLGSGMSQEDGAGLGLRNIKTRARILNGQVKWASRKDGGTILHLAIPLTGI